MRLTDIRLDDGRFVTVYAEFLGTASICIEDNERAVKLGERDGGYDRYYQYPSVPAALDAYADFVADSSSEPDGWIRAAPPYFRRRPEADPAREYVRP